MNFVGTKQYDVFVETLLMMQTVTLLDIILGTKVQYKNLNKGHLMT